MTIRLTDLDQDEQTPIEMIRDPIGVLLIDEEGWSGVSVKAGFSETGKGAPSGIPGAMSWIINRPYDLVNGVKMTIGQPDVRLRASDWLKPDLEEMIGEWGADRYGRVQRAELLAKVVDRVMRLSFEGVRGYAGLSPTREQGLLNMIEKSGSLATGLRIALTPEMERDLSAEKRLSVATFSAMKFGAFVLDDANRATDELIVRLRPPRFGYAERVLSRPVPKGGKWQQAKLDNADLLTPEHIESLKGLNRPVLITARIQAIRGMEDPFLATWTIPTGQGYVRKTYTLDEVVEMSGSYLFHTPMIMVGPGWKEPAAAGLLASVRDACGATQLAHASWSAGIVAENVLCAAMRNGRAPKGKNEGITNPESVWVGAHDRIAMRPYVSALQAYGMTLLGGYAGGVRFKAPEDPEILSAIMNAGWENGLIGQMSLLKRIKEMGGETLSDRELFGGDPAHVISPVLTQGMKFGPLWRIDQIIELGPEKRVGAFAQLIGQ